MLPEESLSQALQVAERIRQRVANHPLQLESGDVHRLPSVLECRFIRLMVMTTTA